MHCFFKSPPSDFERGTIRFNDIGKLLKVKESAEFRSMTARMSCLITIVQKHKYSEVSQLIDIVNDLWIERKYLRVYVETFNTTFLRKKTINFNVIINQEEPGEILFSDNNTF